MNCRPACSLIIESEFFLIATCISKAGVDKDSDGSNDIIVTFWLAESSIKSSWQNSWSSSSTSLAYPSNMYGTSYVRARINGGKYAQPYTNSGCTTKATGVISTAYFKSYSNFDTISSSDMISDFKKYTISKTSGGSDLYNYIVEPKYVTWQLQENPKGMSGGQGFLATNFPNDGSSQTKSDDENKGFPTGFNYISKTGYEAWTNDKLWLPSISETGWYSWSDGIWGIDEAQRANETDCWLRTGDNESARESGYLYPNGNNSGSSTVTTVKAIRPAFHFNLSHALLVSDMEFEIDRENVAKPVVETSTYTYDGVSHQIVFQEYDTTKITITNNTKRSNAGTYDVTVALKDSTYYQWSDGTTDSYTETLTINKKSVEKVSLKNNSFLYTGSRIYVGSGSGSNNTSNYNNYATAYISITGTTYATAIGDYSVTITLSSSNNYQWTDGTMDSLTLSWSIVKGQLTKPSLVDDSLAWTGSAINVLSGTGESGTANVQNYNSTQMNISGTQSATDAGSYTITFAIKNTEIYEWADGTTDAVSLSWTIVREVQQISVPTGKNLDYSGVEQTGVDSGTGYTVSGNTATDAGNYTATVSLIDEWFVWKLSNGTTSSENQQVEWSIKKLKLSKPTVLTANYIYDGTEHSIVFAGYNSTWIEIQNNDAETACGTYARTIALVDDENTEWSDGTNDSYTVNLVINKARVTKPALRVKTFDWTNGVIYVGTGTSSNGTANFVNYDPEKMRISGRQSGVTADNYVVSFELLDNVNYTWADGSIGKIDITWSIVLNPTKISVPTFSSDLTYNGRTQVGVSAGTGYNVSGGEQINAGVYTATLTLRVNYIWEFANGETTYDNQTITWEIKKATVQRPTVKHNQFEYDGREHQIVWNSIDSAKVDVIDNNPQSVTGTYYVQVQLRDEQNYVWSDGVYENDSAPYYVSLIILPKQIDIEPTLLTNDNEEMALIIFGIVFAGFVVTIIVISIAVKRHKKKKASKFQIHRRL